MSWSCHNAARGRRRGRASWSARPAPRTRPAARPSSRPAPAPRSIRRWSPAAAPPSPFVEQEAENATTTGTVIGPDRGAYTLPAEASGRTAVQLTPGQYVEFTLPKAANAITVRYSIPDAPTGGGITAPLAVKVGNDQPHDDADLAVRVALQPVSVQQRPERRPAAPGLVDHRVRLRAGRDHPGAGDHHAVPAEPLLRRAAAAAGQDLPGRREDPADRVAGGAPGPSIDLLDSELVGAAEGRPGGGERAAVRRRPDRPARLGRRVRQGDRVRPQAPSSRCTSRRAPTRSTGTSSSTT